MGLLALALGAILLAAAACHGVALCAFRRSAGTGPVPDRLAAAGLAVALEPCNERLRWREIALEGLALLERGRVDAAYRLLEPYSQTVRGDEIYRSAYQAVVRIKTPLDARKAHQQHARERSDGTLREQDVIR